MSVKDIPNFDQLTDLERLELADALAASIRHPEALPAPSAALSQEQFWSEVAVTAAGDETRTPPGVAPPGRG